MREIVLVRGKPTMATLPDEDDNASLARENSKLRERVTELELALLMTSQGRAGLTSADAGIDKPTVLKSSRTALYDEVGTVLDDWDLGVTKNPQWQNVASGKDAEYFLELFRCLPSTRSSTLIVQFSLEKLGWIHCALRVDQFLAEHEAFQNDLEFGTLQVLENHGWMAIYFSVLTVGLFFMSDEEAMSLNLQTAKGDTNPVAVRQAWYRSALRQLELSDVMGSPQSHTVQVAAILTLCNSHFGESFRGFSLQSLATNTARALRMHCLATESSYPQSLEQYEQWSTQPGRELGRRLWWTLVICDWLAGLRRPSLIQLDSFDCTLTAGNFDHHVTLGGSKVSDGTIVVSPLFDHIEMAKLARLVHDYVQLGKKTSATLCQFLRQLDELEQSFILKLSNLSASPAEAGSEPVWLSGQRSHFLCSINFVRLIFCRILLEPRLSRLPAAWSEIRTHGMAAASKVVDGLTVNPVYQMMWVFGSATIAAGAFLCLDLLIVGRPRAPSEIQEQRLMVERCISNLLLHEHKTAICREGPRALRRLLDLQARLQNEPMTQEDVIHSILSMGRDSEDMAPDTQEDQALPSWLPPAGVETGLGSGVGGDSAPTSISAVLPGLIYGYEAEPSSIDWDVDEAMIDMIDGNSHELTENSLC
ncbi:hypothetical protein LTR10_018209 [Elasticomyces elasticus]|uniref:Xylanolytic transcriptional activator regulatory domain-containing protein n=1 Tax=Exophiala sideris TaxID=1016849 RepID=A0ABR0J2K4_9EURO|nr:hypothetical protein LTR10_018209 [Elasticomyces elasticus]KAK5024909.1 hypothetical protein LTS07_008287 [Exophiala sideris]KAK5031501.1 hypothetical protein LTR13_007829 [Exophiala sideris]KAK5054948.1 hypothetical protein LTR69_008516 [Exophiala sideris]KAK5179828.1 hypothetical protein LTR44_007644 [Eurotiomycetes sp. CCFEE 6388]